MVKIAKHNGFAVTFDEKKHVYTLNNGKELVSGTRFVHGFFPVFDSEKVSLKYAAKHGLDQKQVLAMWREKGERASMFGTNVHAFAEAFIKGSCGDISPMNKDEESAFARMKKVIEAMSEYLDFIEAEMIIFSPDLGVAGTVDLVARHKKSGRIYIIDWKTNESIKTKNRYGGRALEPLGFLHDCNYNKYCLQVNLYQKILADENYFPGVSGFKRVLVHVNEKLFKWIAVPYSGEFIDMMFGSFCGV